jgi:ADP-ribosylglycohydrolase
MIDSTVLLPATTLPPCVPRRSRTQALQTLKMQGAHLYASTGTTALLPDSSYGNGGAMRIAPVAIAYRCGVQLRPPLQCACCLATAAATDSACSLRAAAPIRGLGAAALL